jgi:hypothetical protein
MEELFQKRLQTGERETTLRAKECVRDAWIVS